MKSENTNTSSVAPPDLPVGTTEPMADQGRRRFFGKAVAPAVLTMASSPVMANVVCLTASATTSMHPSGRARHLANSQISCFGFSPTNWASQVTTATSSNTKGAALGAPEAVSVAAAWPAPLTPETKFKDVFSFRPSGIGRNDTLAKVLNMQDQPAARAFVATKLNIASGKVDPRVLGGTTLDAIWLDLNRKGGYVPFVGSKPWSAAKVTTWLASTWGEPLPADFVSWA